LVFLGDEKLFDNLKDLLDIANPKARDLRAGVLANLGRSESPRVAALVLEIYDALDADLRSKAIELLTQRPVWSKALLQAIGRQQIPATALHSNQVAKLMAGRDDELRKLVVEKWGSVRTERNPQREQVIADVRKMLQTVQGNPVEGQVVFQRVCGQCHKIYGQGQDVGPDISANGRASFDQLLSNVLDPSLTIGASYQARTVVTVDGRVLNGLLAEDNDQRVVLKMQGGKIETIPREDIDELNVSQLSLMPEGLETQLKAEELADLFAFLALDKPPADPTARYLTGTPRP
jgi:putative heme-binding domain-containing protein